MSTLQLRKVEPETWKDKGTRVSSDPTMGADVDETCALEPLVDNNLLSKRA